MTLVQRLIEFSMRRASRSARERLPKQVRSNFPRAKSPISGYCTPSIPRSAPAPPAGVEARPSGRAFLELSRLGGSLCTFALDSHPRTLPAYDHLHLSECFETLDRHIRAHLETIVPTNCLTIPRPARKITLGRKHRRPALARPRPLVFAIRARMGEAS